MDYFFRYLFSAYIWGIIFFIILGFVISYLIAKNFSVFAEDKGYDKKKYFWICFLVAPVGVLMVIAMPNKRLVEKLDLLIGPSKLAEKTVENPGPKKCKYCGTPIKDGATYCVRCGNKVD